MLSVVLATHNGADTIGRTLDAFAQLIAPSGGWELVIVNNASTDATESIIFGKKGDLPIDYVMEPRLGKSRAINSGVDRASGDLIVLTDDDVLPASNWLVEWRRVADDYPDISVFGGAIVPQFETPPPAWLARTNWMLMLYAATTPNQGEGPMALSSAEAFGPNWAIRRDVFAHGLRFGEDFMIGPISRMGEETDFLERAVERGFAIGFAPTARVRHIVNAKQVKWRWMLRRFYRHGGTMFFMEALKRKGTFPQLFGIPRYLVKRIVLRCVTLPVIAGSLSALRIMSQLRLIAYDLGAAREARRLARSGR